MSAEDELYRKFASSMGVKLVEEKDGTVSAQKPDPIIKEAAMALEQVTVDAFLDEVTKIAGDLTPEQRADLPKKDFAEPNKEEEGHKGKYPIPDRHHAAVALGFAKMHHDEKALADVKRKIKQKYPDMDVDKKS
jgi:hypothetical protein